MDARAHRLYRTSIGEPATGLALAVLAHAGAVALLLSLDIVPMPPPMAALMVQAIDRRPAAAPEVVPPRPRPGPVRPAAPGAVLASEAAAPAPVAEVARAVPAPMLPIQAPAAAADAVPPRFDADYLDNPKPVYPPLSRRLGEQGRVLLRVFVEADGRAGRIEVRTGSGSDRLDQAAVAAVARWSFLPARQGDAQVGAWVLVPIVFSLKE